MAVGSYDPVKIGELSGFLHGFAGMVLFLSALMLIIATDSLLRVGANRLDKRAAA